MTQECSLTLSLAGENASCENRRFPKGIHVTDADKKSGSGINGVSASIGDKENAVKNKKDEVDTPWGYLLIHNKQVELFKKQIDAYNHLHPNTAHKCFVHYSYKYKQRSNGKGVIKQQRPTVSGLVFLQGETKVLQAFLRTNYPMYHLINNCSTGKPASIDHKVMKIFMEVIAIHPENVTVLRDPFIKFANDHIRLRVLTGLFKGMEGYIVRIDRDRQLVIEFGGYAVAIRGMHKEDFAIAE